MDSCKIPSTFGKHMTDYLPNKAIIQQLSRKGPHLEILGKSPQFKDFGKSLKTMKLN